MSYTQVPNAMWDQMIDNANYPNHMRIWAIVFRYTVCFHREWHEISLSFIADRTGMIRNNVSRELKTMIKNGMIREQIEGKKRLLAVGTVIELDNGGVIKNDNRSVIKNDNSGVIGSDNQEINNIKINNLNNMFIQFWNEYPRKNAKADAQKAFESAIKKAPFELILDGAKTFRKLMEQENRDVRYIKLPAGWLRSELWNDYQPVQTESKIVRIVTQNDSGAENHDRILEIYKHRERYLKQLQG